MRKLTINNAAAWRKIADKPSWRKSLQSAMTTFKRNQYWFQRCLQYCSYDMYEYHILLLLCLRLTDDQVLSEQSDMNVYVRLYTARTVWV